MLDVLITNALVYDGLGGEPYWGNVGIQNEKIQYISQNTDELPLANETLDATGLVLTPGFIDTHASTGFGFFFPHAADHKLFQGITTEIFGNCGTSPAPILQHLIPTMEDLACKLDFTFNWQSLKEYFDRLEAIGLQFNVATLTGHSTLRGGALSNWTETSKESQHKMEVAMKESMEHGSFGLSTGLIYAPGCFAETKEIIDLAKIARKHKGVYASHMRDERDKLEEAIDETLEIGEKASINVLVSHLKAAEKRNFGKIPNVIERLESYNKSHKQQAFIDVYPYTAVSTKLRAFIPKQFLEGGLNQVKNKLNDEKVVEEIDRYIIERDYDLSQMLIISNDYPEWEGKTVAQIASETNQSLGKIICEILIRDTEMWIVYHCIDPKDIDTAITWPKAMICTDSWSHPINAPKRIGVPHPRSYGAFTQFLYDYALQNQQLTFQEAVRKITSMPAAFFGLKNRGKINKNYYADLVLFNKDQIKPKATYTNPCELSEGVVHLWVNGTRVISSGAINQSKAGKVLRKNG